MDFKPITTDDEYWALTERLAPILFSPEGYSPEEQTWANLMMQLVEAYEAENPHLADDPERAPLGAFLREFIAMAEGLSDPTS